MPSHLGTELPFKLQLKTSASHPTPTLPTQQEGPLLCRPRVPCTNVQCSSDRTSVCLSTKLWAPTCESRPTRLTRPSANGGPWETSMNTKRSVAEQLLVSQDPNQNGGETAKGKSTAQKLWSLKEKPWLLSQKKAEVRKESAHRLGFSINWQPRRLLPQLICKAELLHRKNSLRLTPILSTHRWAKERF